MLAIKNARAKEKPYKLYDIHGLYLLIQPKEWMLWRLRYPFGGKEKLLALGHYPDVSLHDARKRRDDAKKLLRRTIDPSQQTKDDQRKADLKAAIHVKLSHVNGLVCKASAKRKIMASASLTHSKRMFFLIEVRALSNRSPHLKLLKFYPKSTNVKLSMVPNALNNGVQLFLPLLVRPDV